MPKISRNLRNKLRDLCDEYGQDYTANLIGYQGTGRSCYIKKILNGERVSIYKKQIDGINSAFEELTRKKLKQSILPGLTPKTAQPPPHHSINKEIAERAHKITQLQAEIQAFQKVRDILNEK